MSYLLLIFGVSERFLVGKQTVYFERMLIDEDYSIRQQHFHLYKKYTERYRLKKRKSAKIFINFNSI